LRLYLDHAQSPWFDSLTRDALEDGSLARQVGAGLRGVNANPAVFAGALERSVRYRDQLSWLTSAGCSAQQSYREVAATDVLAACAVLRPVFESSQETDGFVSLEVTPPFAAKTRDAVAAAQRLHYRIDRPNFLVAIPATVQGLPVIEALISAGRSVHATSIYSLRRYRAVLEAYLAGLETFVARGGNPAQVHGVATFSLVPLDDEVNHRLEMLGGGVASALRQTAGVAQVTLAHRLAAAYSSSRRWQRLSRLGASPQRLGVSSSGASLSSSQLARYVQELALPNTVHALSEAGIAALREAPVRTGRIHADAENAAAVLADLAGLGIDLDVVGLAMEARGARHAHRSFARALALTQADGTR
jgi:transaldolase